MQLMEMKAWISTLPGSPLPTQAAEAAGIDRSTMSRQLKRGNLSAENVIALCRAFGKSPADGLVETGHLERSDFDGAGVVDALSEATNQQILDEITKRLTGGTGSVFLEEAEVTIPASDLDSRRETKAAAESDEVDDDAIIAGIAAGTEKYAAQKRTPPLEENFT